MKRGLPFPGNFWKYVVKIDGGCWRWVGSKSNDGRGQIFVCGSTHAAPRISWRIHKGEIPDGIFVLHSCDNPECTNPDHLRLGTQLDNIADCLKKRRFLSGDNHPMRIKKLKNTP